MCLCVCGVCISHPTYVGGKNKKKDFPSLLLYPLHCYGGVFPNGCAVRTEWFKKMPHVLIRQRVNPSPADECREQPISGTTPALPFCPYPSPNIPNALKSFSTFTVPLESLSGISDVLMILQSVGKNRETEQLRTSYVLPEPEIPVSGTKT